MDSFCLKCKIKTGNSTINHTTDKNGRAMIKSKCSKCGKRKCLYVKNINKLVDRIN